ncbi:hypothetical protein N9023_01915 [Opitutaceae bacterium]|nr:hypothetical protein [Opitutaceae bacterium]
MKLLLALKEQPPASIQAAANNAASGASTGATAAVVASTNTAIAASSSAVAASVSSGASAGATAGATAASTATGTTVTVNTTAVTNSSTTAAVEVITESAGASAGETTTVVDVQTDVETEIIVPPTTVITSFTIQLSYGTVTVAVTSNSDSGESFQVSTGGTAGTVISSNSGAVNDLILPNVGLADGSSTGIASITGLASAIQTAISGLQGTGIVNVPGNVITVSPSS